jgi:hypothetical protein
MFAVNDFNIFTPVWKLPNELYAQRNDEWRDIKELYVRNGSQWVQVWNRNYWGGTGQNHPYWRWSLNFGFQKTDDTLSWGTFWSTGNAGFYSYPTSGQLRLSIGARDGNGFGDVYLDPQTPLRVSPGQVYQHRVTVVSRTGTTQMSLRAYSNTTKEQAFKAGSGRTPFETDHVGVDAGTTVRQNITIPSNHNWIKPYIYISTTASLPRNYVFSNWAFERIS